MNTAEKVATLEALLKRIQRNAAAPRPRAQDVASPGLGPYGGLGLAAEPEPAAVPARAAAPEPRGAEPAWDDFIHTIDAQPAAKAPAAEEPRLKAQAAPAHSTPTSPQAKVAPAAKQPAAPAAKTPAAPVAKTPPTPAAKAPAPAGGMPAAPATAAPKAPEKPVAPAAASKLREKLLE
ncbi:MAG: hypothetical protein IT372_16720, partial [Polyangiaceae bacterium]|nr:hypothetical protein [Polyangiaceae bacterium]